MLHSVFFYLKTADVDNSQ